jgi:hypothetical protein
LVSSLVFSRFLSPSRALLRCISAHLLYPLIDLVAIFSAPIYRQFSPATNAANAATRLFLRNNFALQVSSMRPRTAYRYAVVAPDFFFLFFFFFFSAHHRRRDSSCCVSSMFALFVSSLLTARLLSSDGFLERGIGSPVRPRLRESSGRILMMRFTTSAPGYLFEHPVVAFARRKLKRTGRQAGRQAECLRVSWQRVIAYATEMGAGDPPKRMLFYWSVGGA